MGERCDRCGEDGEDRRTLWMACMYAMHELDVPFKQVAIEGSTRQHMGDRRISERFPILVPEWGEPVDSSHATRGFYTLRVCKDCRADWLNAIDQWFKRMEPVQVTGSGIFVRRNGATVEISEEEWRRENPDREPVRVRQETQDG